MYRTYGLKDGQRLNHTDWSIDWNMVGSVIVGGLLGGLVFIMLCN